jgi:hypothetical protein
MGHDLGIRVGVHRHEVGREPGAQLEVVLDDPVEHDPDTSTRVVVRVRVALHDGAVGGPPGVADAGRGRQGRRDRDRGRSRGRDALERRLE